MYAVIGDREAQDKIRQENWNMPHCAFLKKSPNACRCLPFDPDIKEFEGQPCPNNPYEKYKELLERVAFQSAPVISHIEEVLDDLDWHLLPKEELTADDFEAARIARRESRLRDQRNLARLIAIEVSRIFGGDQSSQSHQQMVDKILKGPWQIRS